jgi:hypothetical protein
MKRKITIILCLILSTQVWLSSLHLFFSQDPEKFFCHGQLSPQAEKILNYHVNIWRDPELREEYAQKEHKNNPEWDFMWRTFLVLSITNIILMEPPREKDLLPVIDVIIDDTIEKINKNGLYYFLMSYGKAKPFNFDPPKSLFHDGEVALMLSARRLIRDDERLKTLHKNFLTATVENMKRCPLLSAESYPDECWLFCNTVSLMAMKISDYIDGTDHSTFINDWLKMAKKHLVDKKTGLLHSAYTIDGEPLHGPEGSSIWMATHCLSFVDEEFARQQFTMAKKELYFSLYSFGFSREWPLSWKAQLDCDAGGIFAIMQVSPSASVFAMLAAREYNDQHIASTILDSINLGGLPTEKNHQMRYSASNLVGDASILYAMVAGTIREKVLNQ